MTDGRGWRFALEVVFLVALAVVLGVADVAPLVIVAIMVAGWVLVALLEWAAWREEPHWGSGSPPHYYVPPAEVPPRRAVDLRYEQGYPAQQREVESPTWIATPEMRKAALGEWPVAAPAPEPEPAPEPVPVAAAVVEEPVVEDAPLEEALVREAAAVVTLEDAPVAAEEEPAQETNGTDPWEAYPHESLAAGARPSRHRIDPLVETAGGRWPWQRRNGDDGPDGVEFPTRPRHGAIPAREGR
jgi:hypothetical protein